MKKISEWGTMMQKSIKSDKIWLKYRQFSILPQSFRGTNADFDFLGKKWRGQIESSIPIFLFRPFYSQIWAKSGQFCHILYINGRKITFSKKAHSDFPQNVPYFAQRCFIGCLSILDMGKLTNDFCKNMPNGLIFYLVHLYII